MKLYIIGTGMGDENHLSAQARDIIKNTETIISSKKINLSFSQVRNLDYKEIIDFIKKENKDICLLVSGDANFFSISNTIYDLFKKSRQIITLPSVSSMQYFASKLNIKYHNWVNLSLHGREDFSLINKLSYNKYVFLLTGGENSVKKILNYVNDFNINSTVYIGENLSYRNEKITKGTVKELQNRDFSQLSVILFENDCGNKNTLFDKDFIRGNVPMTKEIIRWTSINYLNLNENDIVFDIGSGTGSVSVEMASKCNLVVSFEHKEEAIDLIYKNIEKFKRKNIKVIKGTYPIECDYIPSKAFIGGSNGKTVEIIKYLANINPSIEIVLNIIFLENLSRVMAVFNEIGFNYNINLINVAQSKKLGENNILSSNNGVYIIRGKKND